MQDVDDWDGFRREMRFEPVGECVRMMIDAETTVDTLRERERQALQLSREMGLLPGGD